MITVFILGIIGILKIILPGSWPLITSFRPLKTDGLKSKSQCPAQPVLFPTLRPDITEANCKTLFTSSGYRNLSATRLSEAVQIPTVIYDDMGKLGADPRWDVFGVFAPYLERAFPIVYVGIA